MILNRCPKSPLTGDVHDGPQLFIPAGDAANIGTNIVGEVSMPDTMVGVSWLIRGVLHVCEYCAAVYFSETSAKEVKA